MSYSQFHIVGWFEELIDCKTNKVLGTRRVTEQVGRAQGSDGEQRFTLTKTTRVQRGHKETIVKATTEHPVEVLTRYFPICGKTLWNNPLTEDSSPDTLTFPDHRDDRNPNHKNNMSKDKTHTIALATAIKLFGDMGLKTAAKWDAARCEEKFVALKEILDDKEEFDPADITDKASRKVFDECAAALKAGQTITVEAEKSDEDEKPAKKKSKLEDDESEGEDEKPAKKKSDEEDEKPTKKTDKPAAKKTPAKKSEGAKKDEHGFREGTAISKLAAALSKKAQSHNELMKEAGLKGTNYEGLARLVKEKIAVLVDSDEGRAWKLKS